MVPTTATALLFVLVAWSITAGSAANALRATSTNRGIVNMMTDLEGVRAMNSDNADSMLKQGVETMNSNDKMRALSGKGRVSLSDDDEIAASSGIVPAIHRQLPFQVTLSLTLVNSATDQDIVTLNEGDVIDLSQVGRSLNVRVNADSSPVDTMEFWFDGVIVRTETTEPFSLGGDRSGNYKRFNALTAPGPHEIDVRALVGNEVVGELRVGLEVVEETRETGEPTLSPALIDTIPPTSMPVDVESNAPTLSPVAQETRAPSKSPVERDTNKPTHTPVAAVTKSPVFLSPTTYVTHYFVDAGADTAHPLFFKSDKKRVFSNFTATIAKTNPYTESVFQTHRYADWIDYTFTGLEPLSITSVTLGFAEIYQPNCKKGDSARVLDVTVNNMPFLANFDVLNHVPCYTAHFEQGAFKADESGQIVIAFTSTVENAFVSMIEVVTFVTA